MGKLSDTYANLALDIMFGKATNTFPAVFYVALSSTEPTNTGTNVTEPDTAANYARVAISNNNTQWAASAARVKATSVNVTYFVATADWCAGADIGWFALYDASTGGAFVGWGAIDVPAPVLTGIQASFAVGALTITMPGT